MFCSKCGHKVEGMEKFCTQCGAPLESPIEVRKGGSSRWLKIAGIAGAVVLVIVIVALLVGGGVGTSSPEQIVRSFYKEAERLNASALLDLFVEENRWLWSGMQSTFATMDSLSISNLTITVVSQAEDTAVATAEYDLTLRLKDGSVGSQEGVVDHFLLKKVGQKWLITGTDFLGSE